MYPSRNNSLITSMQHLSIPASAISSIVADPSSIASPDSIGISASSATYILNEGFIKGFRIVFILNAVLTALATVASVVMIKHKELTRGDEGKLKKEQERKVEVERSDVEMAVQGKREKRHGRGDMRNDIT
ncbi:hypothetical protein C0991_011460 [Blastosporella zonata]|nr:hypothetical protein C0991_011460 [Blastosporella zonata]